jgi:hypothetical protein
VEAVVDYQMSWIERPDEGMSDVMVKVQVFHKIASVPLSRRDVVVGQKRKFDEFIGQNTRGGVVDWAAVSTAFQTHVDALLAS